PGRAGRFGAARHGRRGGQAAGLEVPARRADRPLAQDQEPAAPGGRRGRLQAGQRQPDRSGRVAAHRGTRLVGADLRRACRDRLQRRDVAHAGGAARAAASFGLPVRRTGAARACPHRGVGRATAGDRGDLRQVDQGRPDAGAGVQGPARRQGSGRRGPGAAVSPDTKVAVQVDGRTLTLTNLGKVLYPESGFTKAEVLDYYQRAAPVLLPHIAGRPLTLKRYPEGVDGEAFFQKHVTAHRPDWIRTARVNSESSRARGTTVTYLVVDDLPALIWAANLAGLELHVPMWRMPRVREPDLLVFDLDPGAPANIVDCCRVAEDLRPILAADGLAPLAKTSGGKGLQLYAPISGLTSEQASEMARKYAERLERDQPRRAVSRMTKALRTGKVLIDCSFFNDSETTVA